jgi:ASC-1-like (ASCH) protein
MTSTRSPVTLTKYLSEPWFSLVRVGKKKYEGRINRGDWSGLRVGDKIIFISRGKNNTKGQTIQCQIKKINKYINFESACAKLGTELVPPSVGRPALDIYTQIYSSDVDQDDIAKNGVIVLAIDKI